MCFVERQRRKKKDAADFIIQHCAKVLRHFFFISSNFIVIFFLSSTSPDFLKLFDCFSFDTVFHSFQSIALKMVRYNVVVFLLLFC